MDFLLWLFLYLLQSLLYAWVLFWGGDKRLEGTFLSFFLLGESLSPGWGAEQLRLYALVAWIATTLMFIVGCFDPVFRALFI